MLTKTEAAPMMAAENRLDYRLVIALLAVIAAPGLLTLLGVDFSSYSAPLDPTLTGAALTDAMFRGLHGAFTHTILEWSAFCVAVFTACLAFAHFRIKRDLVTPVICLALVAAGCMDAFHTFAADRYIDAAAESQNLIPFTWAISRLFNGVICMLGVTFFLVTKRETWGQYAFAVIAVAAVAFALLAYITIAASATSEQLPRTQFQGALVTRPWDVIPLFIFVINFTLCGLLYRQRPSIFVYSLMLSTIPDVATQLHMAFGSDHLFDAHFNIAHFLKIVAYATPCIGLLADYVRINRSEAAHARQLVDSNQALVESQRKLARSNHDLQQFAYIASHDLKAPLRAITNIASWIREDLDDPDAKEEVRDHLNLLTGRAERMTALIEGILSYSRLESASNNVTAVDTQALLDDICQTDLPASHGFNIELADNMPIVHTNEVVLRQVFANLISNAIKHHDRDQGTITISYIQHLDGMLEFSITDDGPGIEPEFHERIFGIFQTLQPRDQTESTGIGLSLVHKLVLSVGGKVQVESAGRGTTFRFTWPSSQSNSTDVKAVA